MSTSAGKHVVEVIKAAPTASRVQARRFGNVEVAATFFENTVNVWQQKANREHCSYVVRCYSTRTKTSTQPTEVHAETKIEPLR